MPENPFPIEYKGCKHERQHEKKDFQRAAAAIGSEAEYMFEELHQTSTATGGTQATKDAASTPENRMGCAPADFENFTPASK